MYTYKMNRVYYSLLKTMHNKNRVFYHGRRRLNTWNPNPNHNHDIMYAVLGTICVIGLIQDL
jgi:hypothetical protein